MIVIYDDIDLEPGQIRIRKREVQEGIMELKILLLSLAHRIFTALRQAQEQKPKGWDLADYVLGRFSSKEREVVDAAIQDAADAVEMIIEKGIDAAMNHYNGSGKKKKEE